MKKNKKVNGKFKNFTLEIPQYQKEFDFTELKRLVIFNWGVFVGFIAILFFSSLII